MGFSKVFTAAVMAMQAFSGALAAPQEASMNNQVRAPQAPGNSNWWLSNIKRQGTVAYSNNNGYKVYRNVKDYGAVGDGSNDDTDAINRAIADGNRCGKGCDSSTITPALVYFPPGTYKVHTPIVAHYYTQLVGDAANVPTLKASSDFTGIAVIDVNPYDNTGNNWFTNQNNFFRQIRNFKIDLTGLNKTTGTGIHWQVAQATSLQNIEFNMVRDKSPDNKQQGLFMENGSGGFSSDLTFNGGSIGIFVGSQQYTFRNLKFNGCKTAIYQNWNWVFTYHGLQIDGVDVGIDMANGGNVQTVGSMVLSDSVFSNTPVAISTVYNPGQSGTNGSLVLDNVDFSKNVPVAIQNGGTKATILGGNSKISSWIQGRVYQGNNGKAVQGGQTAPNKPAALVDGSGKWVTRSKPQYNNVDASKFVSVKSKGAKGDGTTDDTKALQAVFDSIGADQIVYFDHGAYVVSDTVQLPANVKIVGEIWPVIMAGGGNSKFKSPTKPKPVFRVGKPGDVGTVEIQDLIFQTLGPQPGAILMEFNVAGTSPGAAGLWDTHFRVGGSAGTQLQSDRCAKNPSQTAPPNNDCIGGFMNIHLTPTSSAYLENTWFWVADHELDLADHNQINIYNGRGVLIESTKGAWLWGTASEHHVLSNYQLSNAKNVYMGLIQTETAYMQGNPDATVPFRNNPTYGDPDWSKCQGPKCARTWGLRIINSSDVYVLGGGLYSFFDNYNQQCVGDNNCQDNMIDIQGSPNTRMYGVSTKASINMFTVNGQSAALDKDNRNNFCAAVAAFSP
ncbi:hypothetical protein VHEMI02126 [[Torrubiella] hemipterigena]|uniref:Rhamnogalacturonase A/B/Epimerase-like pectate lyase domain-containing protein n=1 Tax=[Torrubiella] hemipterigena TaxID=1531966 RepID=A0A0A1T9J5_9HYPO|nr:hypothetical protein VHEMI02126 [[Torrubiella] hemipterigena]